MTQNPIVVQEQPVAWECVRPRTANGYSAYKAMISPELVEVIPAGVGETRIWDTELIGFCLRVHPSGRKVYAVRYRIGPKERIFTIGTHGSPWSTAAARLKAFEILIGVAGGNDPAHEKQVKQGRRLKVATLIDKYLAEGPETKLEKRPRAWKTDASNLNRHIRPVLGALYVSSVESKDVSKAAKAIIDGATAKTVKTKKQGWARVRGGLEPARRALGAGSAMYSWGISQGLVTHNPFKGVRLPRSHFKERFLSREEAVHLLQILKQQEDLGVINAGHAACVRLLLFTGARKMEIQALTWDEVDLVNKRLILGPARTKSGQRNGERIISLGSSALQVLMSLPRTSDYVFPAAKGSSGYTTGLHKAWADVRAVAGLDNVRLHDLRHSYASFAVANNENIYLISRALGHANTRTTERYLHVKSSKLQELAERTDTFMNGLG